MGTTDHGTQDVSYKFYEEATSADFNKRHLDIIPRGIYQGGHLKRVTDSEITLSPFVVEIGDDDEQISVKSSQNATLNSGTLDSGGISSATPYIVLRWGFVEQSNNYVEVHALANVAAAQSNDIIVGKCVFVGATLTSFDYTDRTLLNVQDILLRVEPTEDSEMKVWVRGGRIQDGSQNIIIPEQKVGLFAVPGSPNSRIDLVYIDTDGTVRIKQGVQGISPSTPAYEGKLVISEVTIVNGDTNIVASRITDVRSFLITSFSTKYDSGWFAVSNNSSYVKAHGLSSPPTVVLVLAADSLTPASYYIVNTVESDGINYRGYSVKIDNTNLTLKTYLGYRREGGAGVNWAHARIIALL